MQRTVKLHLLLAALLATTLTPFGFVWSRTPRGRPCGRTPALNRKIASRAQALARKRFPGIKLRRGSDWQTCRCLSRSASSPCDEKEVAFSPFSFWAKKVKTHFTLLEGALWSGKKLEMTPFSSLRQARAVALKTRKDPVISAAFTGKKLYCTVDYIGACCKERIQKNVTDTSCTSTHMGNLAVPVVFFPVARDPKEAGRQEVVVTNYALPASRVPDDAPGWAEARKMPEVKAWVAAHPTHWIILNTWHRTYMVLAEKPDAEEGLTVIFGKHQSDPTGPMKIVLVRPGTECHDCFKAFDGD